jgi:TolB-like protein
MRLPRIAMLATLALALAASAAPEVPTVYPVAILPFHERGAAVKDTGPQIADLLFAYLATAENLVFVDRAELKKVLEEHELNLSGMVAPGQAVQVGKLTGAKLLIAGSVMEIGGKLYIVAKVIGTETTRVLAASAKGEKGAELDTIVEALATQIAGKLAKQVGQIVPPPVKPGEMIAQLKKQLGDKKRPTVCVDIPERHVGRPTVDPAAATELIKILKETGFPVVDPAAIAKADVVLKGEGFSEFAGQRGNLVSVKARVEVKATDRETDEVIATDRQTAVVVDLTELVAGKSALQKAAESIALRLLPKLVK